MHKPSQPVHSYTTQTSIDPFTHPSIHPHTAHIDICTTPAQKTQMLVICGVGMTAHATRKGEETRRDEDALIPVCVKACLPVPCLCRATGRSGNTRRRKRPQKACTSHQIV
uniref:Uncharacterized protein n=1 Tax=Vitrella brassicaformis TaxID=1169539 RepID=A0A7S1JWK7_9ALVE|mmetsp:Transcript_28152/g.70313  ORF Transcript_28152/g.70313 Transcript_28152/m.70313 type:complete len:111 (+) Transcript_28152:327-659(+)